MQVLLDVLAWTNTQLPTPTRHSFLLVGHSRGCKACCLAAAQLLSTHTGSADVAPRKQRDNLPEVTVSVSGLVSEPDTGRATGLAQQQRGNPSKRTRSMNVSGLVLLDRDADKADSVPQEQRMHPMRALPGQGEPLRHTHKHTHTHTHELTLALSLPATT